jgi:hypothetical protein
MDGHTSVLMTHPMPIRRFAQEEEMLTENGEYLPSGTSGRTSMAFNTRKRHVNYNEDDEDEEDLIMTGDDIEQCDMEFHSTSNKAAYNRERITLAKQVLTSLANDTGDGGSGGTLTPLDGNYH